jgi:hypothetical protein
MARVPARTSILPSLAWAEGGEKTLIVMERPFPPDFLWVAQLRVSGNSSNGYIVNVHNILPPAGVNTLVDSCSFSVSTIVS